MLWLAPAVEVDVREMEHLALRILDAFLDEVPELELLTRSGDLLPGFYDEWLIAERERLRQLRLHALETLCERLTAVGRHSQAIAAGLAAVAGEPLRESAQSLLIKAYLAEGNRAEAIRQFECCRHILRAELGLEPSPQLRSELSFQTEAIHVPVGKPRPRQGPSSRSVAIALLAAALSGIASGEYIGGAFAALSLW